MTNKFSHIRFTQIVLLLFIVISIAFFLFLRKTIQKPSDLRTSGILTDQDFNVSAKDQTISKRNPYKSQESLGHNSAPKAATELNSAGFVSLGILHAEVLKLSEFLNKNEAGRCQILLEKKFEDAHEYYLEVLPPSREEIIATRNIIAEIMESVPKDKKEEVDNNIGQLIYEYDAFGLSGKKILSIRVPDNSESPLSAWTYPVNDVKFEIQRIFSGEQVKAPENMQFYVGSDPNILARFEALISFPEVKK